MNSLDDKTFKLVALVSSNSPSTIKPVLERIVGCRGSVKETDRGIEIQAELEGESAREINRAILSQLRKVEKKTRIRAEYTCGSITERFFDYSLRGAKRETKP